MLMNNYLDKTFTFPAPAKLNLFLHVVGQRADGYHELETLFQFLDYCDTIDIIATMQNNIELLTPINGVSYEDNLIVKAALLLKDKAQSDNPNEQIPYGAKIAINKVLPMGGGLGGGSSNAATVLIALNELWQCHYSTAQLAAIGLTLGADIPIFIHGFAAYAQGVGEKLTPVEPDECWYLISKPDVSISTASVFSSTDLPRNTVKFDRDDFTQFYCDIDLFNEQIYHNDCQTMVIKHYDEVANLLAWLVECAPSRMTGTGACVFSRFESEKEARVIQDKLPKGVESFVAQGLNTSPLVRTVENLDKQRIK